MGIPSTARGRLGRVFTGYKPVPLFKAIFKLWVCKGPENVYNVCLAILMLLDKLGGA
jgi:hypothetical protein